MPAKKKAKTLPEQGTAEPRRITFHYIKSAQHRAIHVDGAVGSATASRLPLVDSDTNTRPVVIEDVRYLGRTFHFKTYLELCPAYDETGELLCLEYKPLGIHVFANCRKELNAELAEQICMLWDEYACEGDENLTPAAIQLKKNLLAALEEV